MPERAPGAPPLEPGGAPFASAWDRALAASGPPSIFTLDPRGELRVDPERSRECELLVGLPEGHDPAHFVLTDARTGLRLYLFVTHPALATCQPRGTVERFPTGRSAIEQAVQQWAVPTADALDAAGDEV
jgi:hypothetical protein